MDTDKREQNWFIFFTGAVLFNYLFEILSFKSGEKRRMLVSWRGNNITDSNSEQTPAI